MYPDTLTGDQHIEIEDISKALADAHLLRSRMFRCVGRNMVTWLADMTLSRLRIKDRRLELTPCACAHA